MSEKLNQKIALILGAAGKDNMGQVMARRFAQEGAKVIVAGRNEDSLIEISNEINGDYAVCDITKKENINLMMSKVIDLHGKLDIGVQALGTMPVRSEKKNQGQIGMDISFGGLTFSSGDYVYADNNGLLLSKKELNLS